MGGLEQRGGVAGLVLTGTRCWDGNRPVRRPEKEQGVQGRWAGVARVEAVIGGQTLDVS